MKICLLFLDSASYAPSAQRLRCRFFLEEAALPPYRLASLPPCSIAALAVRFLILVGSVRLTRGEMGQDEFKRQHRFTVG